MFEIYLKPKITLHCLYIYILVSNILMCLIHIKVRSIIHKAVEFYGVFLLSKMQSQGPNKTCKSEGGNKLFQNLSLLMCYCSFEIGQFKLKDSI